MHLHRGGALHAPLKITGQRKASPLRFAENGIALRFAEIGIALRFAENGIAPTLR